MKRTTSLLLGLAAAACVLVLVSTIQTSRELSLSSLSPAALFGPQPSPAVTPSATPRPSVSPSPSPPPLLPEFKTPPTYKKAERCSFSGCPDKDTHLYMFTPMRNRSPSYHRFIRTLVTDVTGGRRGTDPRCICLAVGHFNEVERGAPLSLALEAWPFDHQVLPLKGEFSPAYAFEQVLEKVVTGKPEQSLIFRMDADMVVFPGFTARVLKNTVPGETAYAPVCWNQHNNDTDWYDGNWRVTGSGMIGFFKSDSNDVLPGGKFPLDNKHTYGEEDHKLMMALHNNKEGYRVFRDCTPELWHLYHGHTKWQASLDGISDKKALPTDWNPRVPWQKDLPRPDGAEVLQATGQVYHRVCRGLRKSLYPGRL